MKWLGLIFLAFCLVSCAASPTSPQLGDIGSTAKLEIPNSSEILLAVDEQAHEQLGKAFLANDWAGVQFLLDTGVVFYVPSGVKVLIIDRAYGIRKVRILEGEFTNQTGWIVQEALKAP